MILVATRLPARTGCLPTGRPSKLSRRQSLCTKVLKTGLLAFRGQHEQASERTNDYHCYYDYCFYYYHYYYCYYDYYYYYYHYYHCYRDYYYYHYYNHYYYYAILFAY